ncbi:hypothetical protein T05_14961 [Trichinella murrelli]|uniref:Uncharacterized protein n=1 Tax=Trichinella murrelli TaxID=144512 RepID=A0A0V0TE71_9BILA|nr:hypothetical protein T05_14961 [Trichinella murrelli]
MNLRRSLENLKLKYFIFIFLLSVISFFINYVIKNSKCHETIDVCRYFKLSSSHFISSYLFTSLNFTPFSEKCFFSMELYFR